MVCVNVSKGRMLHNHMRREMQRNMWLDKIKDWARQYVDDLVDSTEDRER